MNRTSSGRYYVIALLSIATTAAAEYGVRDGRNLCNSARGGGVLGETHVIRVSKNLYYANQAECSRAYQSLMGYFSTVFDASFAFSDFDLNCQAFREGGAYHRYEFTGVVEPWGAEHLPRFQTAIRHIFGTQVEGAEVRVTRVLRTLAREELDLHRADGPRIFRYTTDNVPHASYVGICSNRNFLKRRLDHASYTQLHAFIERKLHPDRWNEFVRAIPDAAGIYYTYWAKLELEDGTRIEPDHGWTGSRDCRRLSCRP